MNSLKKLKGSSRKEYHTPSLDKKNIGLDKNGTDKINCNIIDGEKRGTIQNQYYRKEKEGIGLKKKGNKSREFYLYRR